MQSAANCFSLLNILICATKKSFVKLKLIDYWIGSMIIILFFVFDFSFSTV